MALFSGRSGDDLGELKGVGGVGSALFPMVKEWMAEFMFACSFSSCVMG